MKKTFYLIKLLLVLFGSTSLFAQDILYVGGGTTRTSASSADQLGMLYLESSGYTLKYQDDDAFNDAAEVLDTAGVSIVILSSSTAGSKLDKCAWLDKGVIIWEAAAFDNFGLITGEYRTHDESTRSIVNLDTTNHPILADFNLNDTLLLSYSNISFTRSDAFSGDTLGLQRVKMLTKFASDNNDPQEYAPMGFFEAGDTFNFTHGNIATAGRPANGRLPGRRVLTFLTNNTFETITPEGLAIFLNSVDWAMDGVMKTTVPVVGVGLDVADLSLVDGETATKTGVLFPSNYTGVAPAITYTSQYDTIATFVNGTITALSAGTTKLFAEAAGFKDSINLTVTEYVVPTGVTLNVTTDSTIIVGDEIQLVATVAPANASYKTVTWASSADTIATVSSTGLVTAVRDGMANIVVTTTDGGLTDTVTINVNKIPVTGVMLTFSNDSAMKDSTVFVGATIQLLAVVTPDTASFKTVTWSSTATGVATVDADGLVSAVGAGTAAIVVTTDSEALTDTFNIIVNAVANPVTGVTLDIEADTILVGGTLQLTETVAPADADLKAVTWSSTSDAIATVSATGLVTGVSVGIAKISVKTNDGNFTDTVTVTVAPVPVSGVTLNKATSSILIGATDTLVATVAPANAANKSVNWSSSDATVASVSATGVVTAVKVGTATITVTTVDGDKTATCAVTVDPVRVTGITLSSTSDTINVGDSTSKIIVTIAPTNATNKTITWTSSAPTVATVPATGNNVRIKGIAKGTATITATVDGKTATYAITVIGGGTAISNLTQVNCEVYPNPVTDILRVNASNITSVSIINALGSQVLKVDSDFENGIDVSGLEAGLYVVNVTTTDGTIARVVIKK